ncbi:class IIb bacteriocin, lactobin A/cerein 7B family [Streptococcus mutans]|nr:class IIb bacteriocin, lactobin A/cerein 7B family [Streptococcus mutans]MDP5865708.1 class IIb bacteriocin, lactobin A/cerein 7B family [Streptococcus mutans]
MIENEMNFVELSVEELAAIEGGFNPFKAIGDAAHDFAKGFQRGW